MIADDTNVPFVRFDYDCPGHEEDHNPSFPQCDAGTPVGPTVPNLETEQNRGSTRTHRQRAAESLVGRDLGTFDLCDLEVLI